jgi:hypothetical protein
VDGRLGAAVVHIFYAFDGFVRGRFSSNFPFQCPYWTPETAPAPPFSPASVGPKPIYIYRTLTHPTHFCPEYEANMYLPNIRNTASIHILQWTKSRTNIDNEPTWKPKTSKKKSLLFPNLKLQHSVREWLTLDLIPSHINPVCISTVFNFVMVQGDSKLLSGFPWPIIFKPENNTIKLLTEYESVTQRVLFSRQ